MQQLWSDKCIRISILLYIILDPTTFFESLITHKQFIFEESYISHGKCQNIHTLIVI